MSLQGVLCAVWSRGATLGLDKLEPPRTNRNKSVSFGLSLCRSGSVWICRSTWRRAINGPTSSPNPLKSTFDNRGFRMANGPNMPYRHKFTNPAPGPLEYNYVYIYARGCVICAFTKKIVMNFRMHSINDQMSFTKLLESWGVNGIWGGVKHVR